MSIGKSHIATQTGRGWCALMLAAAVAVLAPRSAIAAERKVDDADTGAYYFISGRIPGESYECIAAKMPLAAFLKLTFEHLSSDSFVDVLTFQGRLPGTTGLEFTKKSEVNGNSNHSMTMVVSDSLLNCRDAAGQYADVREALERSKWVGFSADQEVRGKKDRDKGRIVFTMTCHQRRGRSGKTETTCETIKPCRTLSLESQDPKNPFKVQASCKWANLMVD